MTALPVQLGELGELGRNGFLLMKNQRLAALQIDGLSAYAFRLPTLRTAVVSMREKFGGDTLPQIDTFEQSIGTFGQSVAQGMQLIAEARDRLAARPYRGRGHQGSSSIEAWGLAVEIDLGEMRRLLPQLEADAREADDAMGNALVAVQRERIGRGQANVKPWIKTPRTGRINWNGRESESEILAALKGIRPGLFGGAIGSFGTLAALAALWIFIGRR